MIFLFRVTNNKFNYIFLINNNVIIIIYYKFYKIIEFYISFNLNKFIYVVFNKNIVNLFIDYINVK